MVRVGRDLKDHLVPTCLSWAGTSSTRPGCSELHPTWPWTLPGRGQPQLLWALLAMLVLMQPRIWLAFLAASAHCWLMLSFSSTSTPKCFSSELLSGHSPPTLFWTMVLLLNERQNRIDTPTESHALALQSVYVIFWAIFIQSNMTCCFLKKSRLKAKQSEGTKQKVFPMSESWFHVFSLLVGLFTETFWSHPCVGTCTHFYSWKTVEEARVFP